MSVLRQMIYRFNRILMKIPVSFYVAFDTSTLKLTWSCKGLGMVDTSSRGERGGRGPPSPGRSASRWHPAPCAPGLGAGAAPDVSPRMCGCLTLYEISKVFHWGQKQSFQQMMPGMIYENTNFKPCSHDTQKLAGNKPVLAEGHP